MHIAFPYKHAPYDYMTFLNSFRNIMSEKSSYCFFPNNFKASSTFIALSLYYGLNSWPALHRA